MKNEGSPEATRAKVPAADRTAAGLPPVQQGPRKSALQVSYRKGIRPKHKVRFAWYFVRSVRLSFGGSNSRISDSVWDLDLKSSSSQFHKRAESTGTTEHPALLVNPKV